MELVNLVSTQFFQILNKKREHVLESGLIFSCLKEDLGMPIFLLRGKQLFGLFFRSGCSTRPLSSEHPRGGSKPQRSGRVSGALAAPEPARARFKLVWGGGRGDGYWITGRLLRHFSGLDRKAHLLEGKARAPLVSFLEHGEHDQTY